MTVGDSIFLSAVLLGATGAVRGEMLRTRRTHLVCKARPQPQANDLGVEARLVVCPMPGVAAVLLRVIAGVSGGDTLTARCGSAADAQTIKVRVAKIDAPSFTSRSDSSER
jgi:hypothetical protein